MPSNGKRVKKDFFSQLKKMQKQEGSEALVPATFLVIAALDAIPHPGDIGYFYTEKWLLENKSKMPANKWWAYKALNYYGWDVAWYIALFGLTYYGGKNVNQKIKLGIGAVSAGLLAHFIFKQSQKRKQAAGYIPRRPQRTYSALAMIGQTALPSTLILDTRTQKEYDSGHIPSAVLVPTPLPPLDERAVVDLARRLAKLTEGVPKSQRILVYCKKGIRAGKAVDILRRMGFEDVTNLGGVLTNPRLAQAARERSTTSVLERYGLSI